MKSIICRLLGHRPLFNFDGTCIDKETGKEVYISECSCGIYWATFSAFPFWGRKFKVNWNGNRVANGLDKMTDLWHKFNDKYNDKKCPFVKDKSTKISCEVAECFLGECKLSMDDKKELNAYYYNK